MTVRTQNVYLYAAVAEDYIKCLAAADVCGVANANVIGDYQRAWNLIADGRDLVIAVGGAALYALYYNPCGWPNPAGNGLGKTPFEVFPSGRGIDVVRPGSFVNAAGYTALDSLKLAIMLGYYGLHGVFPATFQSLPQQENPQQVCVRGATPVITGDISSGSVTPTHPTAPTVGVYASFYSAEDVMSAIQRGWSGIGHTAALGTRSAPYTSVLVGRQDLAIDHALNQTSGKTWWLSFWTVSWPIDGDTFYNAGYQAGHYAATIVDQYSGKYKPNYLIVDPEGYNRPAVTEIEWSEFIHGWSDGIKATNQHLEPAFYCNQSQYKDYNLSSVDYPAFIAIAPIQGNKPMVSGQNIMGYIAYYGGCPVVPDMDQMKAWGGMYNTIQFRDSGVDCSPL